MFEMLQRDEVVDEAYLTLLEVAVAIQTFFQIHTATSGLEICPANALGLV